ncbi:MAG: hybrid sensor histidine kinase/response regulator [Desulfamplus sp.]|nr:hybrid sensor histidine kinase/response regulator [Desulfamplus sp.]
MAIDRSKFLARFADEAREHCAKITDGLLYLENTVSANKGVNTNSEAVGEAQVDTETINSLFRSAHTIKGSARMMKLGSIGELAHGMEDLLDGVRGGKIRLNSQFFELLFKSVDALLLMVEKVTTPEGPPEAPVDLCAALKEAAILKEAAVSEITPSNDLPTPAAKPLLAETEILKAPDTKMLPIDQKSDADIFPVNQKTQTETKSLQAQAPLQPNISPQIQTPQAQYLHINTAKLDDLIHLMGEIISDHNRFKQDVRILQENARLATHSINTVSALIEQHNIKSNEIKRATESSIAAQIGLQHAARRIADAVLMQSHLMGELQETTLKLCMMPLATVFEPLRRAVRDLAKEAGKEVQFIVTGGETELDRKIAERIGDSLLHMIRNSLDHGIESPDERIAAGKSPKGTIILSAFYDSGGVTIALKDDGQGINPEKIKAKASAKNLFDAETLNMMSRTEILNLIFLPGFSTSLIITDLSGRGVGMDVVRKNIVDELKGTVVMESLEGEGTSFMLRLPLNLAVFPLCMVSAGGRIFALPATSIAELCTVNIDEIIEIIGKKAIRLREEIIPVEYLTIILKLNDVSDTIEKKTALSQQSASVSVVVVKDGANKLGVMVDDIIGREEMVVKPLPSHLSNLKIVTGGTIGTGDSIVNVLHIPEIVRLASKHSDYSLSYDKLHRSDAGDFSSKVSATNILVVDDSVNTREIEKSILEAYGYNVETADDGQDALEKADNKLYDLVITDVEMPRLSGFSLTEQLRADSRYKNVPIIIVTSLDKESDKKRGIMVGADAYIVKRAFDQSNLLDTVKSLIG